MVITDVNASLSKDDLLAAHMVTLLTAPVIAEKPVRPLTRWCEWFSACGNEAEVKVSHPILGCVPTCMRCVNVCGLEIDMGNCPGGGDHVPGGSGQWAGLCVKCGQPC